MTLRDLSQRRWLLSSLLLAGAALFAIGVAAERHAIADHSETGAEAVSPAQVTAAQTAPAGETGGEATHTDETTSEGTTHTEAPTGETGGHSESAGETVLGLNLESNALAIVAVAASLALAALTWMRNRRSLLFATMAVAVVFAVFDVAEVAHQFKESPTGLATLAAAIALVHVATALVAEQRATTPPHRSSTSAEPLGPRPAHAALMSRGRRPGTRAR